MDESFVAGYPRRVRLLLGLFAAVFGGVLLALFTTASPSSAEEAPPDSVVDRVATLVEHVTAPVSSTAAAAVQEVVAVAAPVVQAPVVQATPVPAVVHTVTETVANTSVSTILTPVAGVVDSTVGALPVVGNLPLVDAVLGESPITTVTDPVVDAVDTITDGLGAGVDAVIPDESVDGIGPVVIGISVAGDTSLEVSGTLAGRLASASTALRADLPTGADAAVTPSGVLFDAASGGSASAAALGGASASGSNGAAASVGILADHIRFAFAAGSAHGHTDDRLPGAPVSDSDSSPD
ncbi:hypothetical protein CLV46_0044 [Diaminobutyricimonas aerilata]|uniref:Uncharacterized protein n=1 Tax=Diaminobutyricimonas aerilata TaxID=1162967 RepID=A0A2M9CF88_9MICO|nr:hypothetical protein [Diaminobutyricimonas aerilata]PJJ70522.1 hypothetical protein CLV46_0044 [Diaminobutyricimonas aerilata]